MSQKIVDKYLNFIKENSNYNDFDLKKIKYGFEGIILTITKLLIVIILAILLREIEIVIMTLIFFNILRFFAFGLHAKTSSQCLVISVLLFNIFPLLFIHINFNIYLFALIAFLSFLMFAPGDTEKRPMKNRRKRYKRKMISCCLCIIYSYIAIRISFLKIPIVCSLIIESLMINPISYKLLGLKYNNYNNC